MKALSINGSVGPIVLDVHFDGMLVHRLVRRVDPGGDAIRWHVSPATVDYLHQVRPDNLPPRVAAALRELGMACNEATLNRVEIGQ